MEEVKNDDKIDLIQLAIKQMIIEDKKNQKNDNEINRNETVVISRDDDDDDDEAHLMLSRLLSQVELLKEDKITSSKTPEPLVETNMTPSSDDEQEDVKVEKKDEKEMGTEEIIKELKKIKRQNYITHGLLSLMILLTVAWQLSEISLIMSLKEKVRNPFRSIGNLIKGAVIGGGGGGAKSNGEGSNNNKKDAKSSLSDFCSHIEPPLPELKIPELSHVDLPVLGRNGNGED